MPTPTFKPGLTLALTVSVIAATSADARQAAPAPAAPPVAVIPAPPPPIPIEPTRKEDRIEYTVPPSVLYSPPPPPRPYAITSPRWTRQPMPEYPAAAMHAGLDGQVTLRCVVQTDGLMTGCEVLSETPAGYGFAQSALASVPRARVSPRTVEGAAENARVAFTLRYRLPEEPAPVPVPPAPAR